MECRLRGILGYSDGDCSWDVEAQFSQGDGQAVHDDGADDQEPDDDGHDLP